MKELLNIKGWKRQFHTVVEIGKEKALTPPPWKRTKLSGILPNGKKESNTSTK